jgi:hypothetical protein
MAHQQTMAMFVSHNQRVDRFSFCQMALIEIDGLPVYLAIKWWIFPWFFIGVKPYWICSDGVILHHPSRGFVSPESDKPKI